MGEAVQELEQAGALGRDDAEALTGAWRLYSGVRQLQGAANLIGRDLRRSPETHHDAILRGLDAPDWRGLQERIEGARSDVSRVFRRFFSSEARKALAA